MEKMFPVGMNLQYEARECGQKGSTIMGPQDQGTDFYCHWECWLFTTHSFIPLQELLWAKDTLPTVMTPPHGWSTSNKCGGTKAHEFFSWFEIFLKGLRSSRVPHGIVRFTVATGSHFKPLPLYNLIFLAPLRGVFLKALLKTPLIPKFQHLRGCFPWNLIFGNLLNKSKFVWMYTVISTRKVKFLFSTKIHPGSRVPIIFCLFNSYKC